MNCECNDFERKVSSRVFGEKGFEVSVSCSFGVCIKCRRTEAKKHKILKTLQEAIDCLIGIQVALSRIEGV